MRRLSCSEFSSFQWTFFQDVLKYSSLGISNIGVWRSKLEEYGVDEAAELLAEMKMEVSSLSWAGGFTGSNGFSFHFAVEDAIEAVYQAHAIGAKNLILHPGGRNGHTDNHAMRLLRLALDAVVPVAQDRGICLLFEPVLTRGNVWSFLNSPTEYLELIRRYEKGQLGLVLDLYHTGLSTELLQSLPEYIDRVELVQLADTRKSRSRNVRCRLGKGNVPVQKWIEKLEDMEFTGYFEVELHGTEFENQGYQELISGSREFLASTLQQVGTRSAQ